MGNLRPAWTFDMTRIRIFVTQFRVQDHVKTKFHDKQYLESKPEASTPEDSMSYEAYIPRGKITVEF